MILTVAEESLNEKCRLIYDTPADSRIRISPSLLHTHNLPNRSDSLARETLYRDYGPYNVRAGIQGPIIAP